MTVNNFKCVNCGYKVVGTFKIEQVITWNKQCKVCNTADLLQYEKRNIRPKQDLNMFGESVNLFQVALTTSVAGLISTLNTSHDLSQLFN